ncbi:unnamed protein product [Camellia sinensis]
MKDLGIGEVVEPASPSMYLAIGLGIGRADASASNVEEYYKRMVGEDPSNPLFLRNYAQLLQVHFLAAYACFLWEIEEDKEDCSVNDHTQIEEDDKVPAEDQKTPFEEENELVSPSLHLATGVRIDIAVVGGIDGVDCNAADFGKEKSCSSVDSEEYEPEALVDSGMAHRQNNSDVKTGLEETHRGWFNSSVDSLEDYYKRMVVENPSNALFLRNYAQVLYQSPSKTFKELSNTTSVQYLLILLMEK